MSYGYQVRPGEDSAPERSALTAVLPDGAGSPDARPANHPVRVALVDQHTLFREGLVELLSRDEGFEVVGEGRAIRELMDVIREVQPDILLFDVPDPAQYQAGTLAEVSDISPNTQLMLLTMDTDPATLRNALECGAHACVTKTVGREQLVAAIRLVSSSAGYTMTLVPRFDQTCTQPDSAGLSEREMQVLCLLNLARSNAQIARELHISESTVKRHLTKIYAKLNAVSRVDALKKAVAAGLLVITDPRL